MLVAVAIAVVAAATTAAAAANPTPPHPDAASACAAMNTSGLIEVMHGPSSQSPSFAPRYVRRALLIPQADPGSLYRCSKSA